MVRCDRFVMAVLAAAVVAAPASGALFDQDFTGVADNTPLTSEGWSAATDAATSDVRVNNEAIDGGAANTGWSRANAPFVDNEVVTSGIVRLSMDFHQTGINTDAEMGFMAANGSNATAGRGPTVGAFDATTPCGASSLVLKGVGVGGSKTNICAGFDGAAHVALTVDFDTLFEGLPQVSATFTPSAGQNGGNPVTLTGGFCWDGPGAGNCDTTGTQVYGLWLAGAIGSDLTADNLLVTIPEPATLGLIGMGGLLMAIRRRRA